MNKITMALLIGISLVGCAESQKQNTIQKNESIKVQEPPVNKIEPKIEKSQEDLIADRMCDFDNKVGCLTELRGAKAIISAPGGVIINDVYSRTLFIYTKNKYYDGEFMFSYDDYYYEYKGLHKIGSRTFQSYKRSNIKI